MKRRAVALLCLLLLGASTAWAQCREGGSIRFPRGRTSTVIKGRVTAARAVCYKFRARPGQRLIAHLTSPGKRARFSLLPDAFDTEEIVSDTSDWEGELDGSYGNDYILSVYLPKGSDTFTLEVTIR